MAGHRSLRDTALAGLLFAIAQTTSADTINVPIDAPTIQAAVDLAQSGDEIVLADGVYTGVGNVNVTIADKSILIRSAGGAGACTINMEGIDDRRSLRIQGASLPGVTVEGITFLRGRAIVSATEFANGGAIYATLSALTIRDCDFAFNHAYIGGAVQITDGVLLIQSCTFENNETTSTGNFRGGGGVRVESSEASIIDCVFDRNSSQYGGALSILSSVTEVDGCTLSNNTADLRGGAIVVLEPSRTTLRNCDISNNACTHPNGQGGGMYGWGNIEIVGCRFANNSTGERGGGLYVSDANAAAAIRSSVFEFNVCAGVPGDDDTGGGGVHLRAGPATLHDTIFRGNVSPRGGGALITSGNTIFTNCTFYANSTAGLMDLYGSADVRNSISWGHDGQQFAGAPVVQYSAIEGGLAGIGNIDADPQFVDPAGGDFRLLPGSPCIDAGLTSAVPVDALDLDGDGNTCERIPIDLDGSPRLADVPATPDTGCGAGGLDVIVDMGAYEHQGVATQTATFADTNGDHETDFQDLVVLLSSWTAAAGCWPADVNGDLVVDFQDLVRLIEAWGSCPPE